MTRSWRSEAAGEGALISRDAVATELRKKFDEDKGAKRMERSEIVLKKFGLIDRDFHLRPFLLSLLTEQIARYYDANKTQAMTLLDWVPEEQQLPVMAHELTHALQDQKVGLEKWGDQEVKGVSQNVVDDNRHIQVDETDTAREAVLEGQAMLSFGDYALKDSGKTMKDMPEMAERIETGAGDMSGSPVMARAPLLLQAALLFPYVSGLGFEEAVLVAKGTAGAFAGTLDRPPSSSFEMLQSYAIHGACAGAGDADAGYSSPARTGGICAVRRRCYGRTRCADYSGVVWRTADGPGAGSELGGRNLLRCAEEVGCG